MKPMLNLLIFVLSVQWATTTQAQTTLEHLDFDAKAIPAGIEYKGNISDGKHWKDANGENYILLTRSDDLIKKMDDGKTSKSALVSAVHYARQQDGTYRLIRKLHDFVRNCTARTMIVNHIQNSLSVTDLDANGKAEIIFLYKTACGSDETVIPNIHLTLLENGEKYPMRGTMSYQMRGRGEGEPVRMQIGDQSVGAEFENAPSLFLEYAHKHWNTFAVEER